MRCKICSHKAGYPLSVENRWYQCPTCQAEYCDACHRGAEAQYPVTTSKAVSYEFSRLKRCTVCGTRVRLMR